MFASAVVVFALAAVGLASPTLVARAPYQVYNDGTQGTIIGSAGDFNATYEASTFLSRGGCSTTAKITACYAVDASGDPKKQLADKDYVPYITGGQGTTQRSLLLSRTQKQTSGIITHKVRFHISTAYTNVPLVGVNNEVTFVGLRNSRSSFAYKALDVRARTFTGEETSGTQLYVAGVAQDGSEFFPTSYPLADALGKTIEVTYVLGVNGQTVDKNKAFVADITAKFVDTGAKLFDVSVTKTLFPKGVVDPTGSKLVFGVERKAATGFKELKTWVGDYSVSFQGANE